MRDLTGIVCGRRIYEVMRYWDEDLAGLGRGGTRLRGGVAEPTEVGWSRSLKAVGPNATLVEDDIEAVIGWAEGTASWGD